MALNFPNNPFIGDRYVVDTIIYIWDGTSWSSSIAAGASEVVLVKGDTSYIHIAYANSANGATDFHVSDPTGRAYIGQYTDFVQADSTNYENYSWSLLTGADGATGADGTNGLNSYLHIAYATSADGSTGFSINDSTNKTYIGTYTNFSASDSLFYYDYDWTLIKGGDGADGSDGSDGVDSYLHIAYATAADGSTGFSTSISTNKTYIGTYANSLQADSEVYTDYTWTLIKGADGADGTDGADGLNSYLHIAYATAADGSAGFSTTVSTGKTYIGQYTNFVLEDSVTYTDYNWTLIKGADGADGSDGTNGTNAYLHIAYSTSPTGATGFSTSVSTGATYIGQYTNTIALDSETPGDYAWTLIKGADGADGSDGANGLNAYLHIAYATASDGSTGFSTTVSTGKTYIGQYTNNVLADSQTPSNYDWTLIKGADGADGSDGANGLNAYLHIAYATSADGSANFSTSVSTGKTYIGQYTNNTLSDSETYTDYSWSLIKGADGADGSDGANGLNAYLHIAYATAADGSTGFSTSISAGKTYIGQYTNNVQADSQTPGNYSWTLIKGADGADGSDGADGVNSYLHIAYADSVDGLTNFSTTNPDRIYMGQYSNSSPTDSQTPGDYTWSRIVGNAGADGADGDTLYLHIAYSTSATGSTGFSTTSPTGATYIGTYTDTNVTDSEVATAYTWVKFAGTDGSDGSDGTSVVLKGSVATTGDLPTGATAGDLYVVLADGDGYVSDGADGWSNVGQIQGPDGAAGADGSNAYVHFAYATSSNGQTDFSVTPFVGAKYIGQYTDFTATDSTTYTDYAWSLFAGADGADGSDGTNGLPSYIHYAYSTASDGSTGFSTSYTGSEKYVGFYSDFTLADSTTYTDYAWSLFTGADGVDGSDGANGLNAYIHYAYSTNADGTDFSVTYSAGDIYVGFYTDFTEADELVDKTKYTWALFKGADGANGTDGTNGLPSYVHYAYATSADGSAGFSTSYTGSEKYVGFYTDFTASDSVTYTDYEWALFTGADGNDGSDGANGLNAYVHYAYSPNASGDPAHLTYQAGDIYVGFYTDFTEADSTNYLDYNWSLFKGADGLDGADGTNGLASYIHYAYSTASDGSTGFSTTYTGTEKYVGFYTDFNIADSNTYTDYDWSLFTGADGNDGNDGANGLNSYLHYAYATSANGSTGFSVTYTGVEPYVGFYTDFTATDSTTYTDYDWSLFKGADGADGENGLPSYIHYAYSTAANGSTGFSTSYTGVEQYVGFYSDFTLADSTTYTDYEWSLFTGADGNDGNDGANGLNAYVHYAYATNATGSAGFSLTYTGVERYSGWYTDFTEADSTNYTDYEWSLFTGADGENGTPGLNAYAHVAYSTAIDGSTGFSTTVSAGKTYIGTYTDNTEADSQTPSDYNWALIKGTDGTDGADGTDGTNGIDGAAGPGILFTGLWNSTTTYFGTATRRDVVEWPSDSKVYYAAIGNNTNEQPPSNGIWEPFITFKALATGLLLADDAAVTKGLVIGSGVGADDTTAFIKSANAGTLTGGTAGFYLEDTGKFRLGNTEANNLYWNGSTLTIDGNISGSTGSFGPVDITSDGITSSSGVQVDFEDSTITPWVASTTVNTTKVSGAFVIGSSTIGHSTGTGPSDAYQGSKYLYLESSGTGPYTETLTYSFGTATTQPYVVSFFYHAEGVDCKQLKIKANNDTYGIEFEVGTIDYWKKATYFVPTGATSVVMTFVTGASFVGDIAIDALVVSKASESYYNLSDGFDFVGPMALTSGTIGNFNINATGNLVAERPVVNGYGMELSTGTLRFYTLDSTQTTYDEYSDLDFNGLSVVDEGSSKTAFFGSYGIRTRVPASGSYTFGVHTDGGSTTTREELDILAKVAIDGDRIWSPHYFKYTTFTVYTGIFMQGSSGYCITRVSPTVEKIDLHLTFTISSSYDNIEGDAICSLPATVWPDATIYNFLGNNPGTDYETATAPYYKLDTNGVITIDATDTSEAPVTIMATYFVTSTE